MWVGRSWPIGGVVSVDSYLLPDVMGALAGYVGDWVAFGIGFGAVLWLMGWGVYWVYLFIRY